MNWQSSLGRGALDLAVLLDIVPASPKLVPLLSVWSVSPKGISQYFAPILEGWLVVLWESNEA